MKTKSKVVRWFYSTFIESKLLYGVVFWWTALNKLHNIKLLDMVRRHAAIHITYTPLTNPTKAVFTVLYWLPTVLHAKQPSATWASALSGWRVVLSGLSYILEIYTVAPLNTDYLPVEYCFDWGFHYLIPTGPLIWFSTQDSWMYIPMALNSLTRLGSGVYSGECGAENFSPRLQDICSVFQSEVMPIYQAATHILIFSDSQTAIKFLLNVVNNSRIIREYRRWFELLKPYV